MVAMVSLQMYAGFWRNHSAEERGERGTAAIQSRPAREAPGARTGGSVAGGERESKSTPPPNLCAAGARNKIRISPASHSEAAPRELYARPIMAPAPFFRGGV